MKNSLLVAALVALALTACSKKEEVAPVATPPAAEVTPPAADATKPADTTTEPAKN